MKKVVFILCLTLGITEGMACSMEVDENYTKNLLVAHATSFHSLFTGSVSGITVSDYDLSYSGGDSIGSCPEYVTVVGRISFEHSPSLVSHCSYEVTVTHTTYIGNDVPAGSVEDVSFSSPTAACSTSLSRVRFPRKIPLRPRKPIIKPLPH